MYAYQRPISPFAYLHEQIADTVRDQFSIEGHCTVHSRHMRRLPSDPLTFVIVVDTDERTKINPELFPELEQSIMLIVQMAPIQILLDPRP